MQEHTSITTMTSGVLFVGLSKVSTRGESEHVEIDGIDTTKARADFCPLIEVPTPHGRLIDADAIQDYNVETFGQRLLIIDTAPTVIEAED